MEKVKIIFLGTGDSIPTKERNHTAILICFKSEKILIDCGEGTQRQMRIAGISPSKISKVLITHKHGDHTFGLPGLFETLSSYEHKKSLEIYGPKGIIEYISKIENITGKGKIPLSVKEVSGKFIDNKDYYIESAKMKHGTPTNAYSIVLKEKVRIDKNKLKKLSLPNSPEIRKLLEGKSISYKGRRISSKSLTYKENSKKITIILDSLKNKNSEKLAKGSDVLISEATFLSEESEKAYEHNHMTAKEAAELAKKSNSKSLIITHLSQRYSKDFRKVLREAKSKFQNVNLAKDFMSLTI